MVRRRREKTYAERYCCTSCMYLPIFVHTLLHCDFYIFQFFQELITEYTKNREEIDSRPIKRVAEAKARNKRRVAKKLDKLKKKLEGVMDNPDMTEAEKVKQAKQLVP